MVVVLCACLCVGVGEAVAGAESVDFRSICCSECEEVRKSRRPLGTLLAAKGFGCTCVFGVVAVLQRRRYIERG